MQVRQKSNISFDTLWELDNITTQGAHAATMMLPNFFR
jgi:hypothetical protein